MAGSEGVHISKARGTYLRPLFIPDPFLSCSLALAQGQINLGSESAICNSLGYFFPLICMIEKMTRFHF